MSEIERLNLDWVCSGWCFAEKTGDHYFWRDLWLQFDAASSVLRSVGRHELADEFFFLARVAFIHRMEGAL